MFNDRRVAVVTGAAQGIGREIAVRLAERGAKVALMDIGDSFETENQIVAAGGECMKIVADVSDEKSWDRAAKLVEEKFGRADILVNNAGVYPLAEFDELDYAQWSRVLRINLDSQYLGAKAFVPFMKKQKWGRIVNIASNSIGTPTAGLSHYMASKMGAIGFTRGLANDLGKFGITVNAVAPALTKTPGTNSFAEDRVDAAIQWQSIKRIAEPYDIAGPVLFLTSEDSGFVTGQLLVVDGGMMKIC
ncbi:SDR family NAD(P)-dependent oxidoreductase [Burkholderia sp. Ac-20353]|uniref:SDR family NAD(P)-dependent oxidoreductase n=1 Tax=Burkholderia sp. Ac-20353 TaxID=2703894 RepID=UPI00197B5274|nr:SDR family NAD(P)-dependent oxidoreductase [Burkholderia sp. Ac-20353]MBN3788822.1 SDR family oxidoreductase [Burkholderia sp. Ac-20353]